MNSFETNSKSEYALIEELPTYLLARDEDCENSFHSTADFVSLVRDYIIDHLLF